jgi:futalosine hydrolase
MAAVLAVCAVPREGEPLRRRLGAAWQPWHGWLRAHGRVHDQPVVLLAGGMGKANAAQAVTAIALTEPVAGVLGFGIGGAYARAQLPLGAVALASEELYADEGVITPRGWRPLTTIGIPLLERDGAPWFNAFPLDPAWVHWARRVLGLPPAAVGRFLTVSTCSGRASQGDFLATRFAALVETMEGAAWAHAAARFDLPFVEVRGISNRVDDRNLAAWRFDEAAHAAADAAARLLAAWITAPETYRWTP